MGRGVKRDTAKQASGKRAAKKEQRDNRARQASGRYWTLAFAALLGAITLSGLTAVENADRMRELYQQSGEVQRAQDRLAAEHTRLLLERGALSSLASIEEIAEAELGMKFPEQVERVLR